MTKRTGHIETGELHPVADFEAAGIDVSEPPTPENLKPLFENIERLFSVDEPTPLQRLIDSGIVTATDSAISWREGHLEHVARAYVANEAFAWRDYADDLTVALSADGSTFAALVERARGG